MKTANDPYVHTVYLWLILTITDLRTWS